ncbi:lipoprotein [Algiphilus sp. W345]|uniref:Lipoprotein n=1 Tax=Banduia mediterranea TaxID=3075609 RepID=A0ABU2WH00_9GAMM|nr:lipoprotein [Algiphilus sp. W345]MDT0497147.1 lipoprotein [Algiphilus sp. W345]
MFKRLPALLCLPMLAALYACGQTGSLYLPDQKSDLVGIPEDSRAAAQAAPIAEPADQNDGEDELEATPGDASLQADPSGTVSAPSDPDPDPAGKE